MLMLSMNISIDMKLYSLSYHFIKITEDNGFARSPIV